MSKRTLTYIEAVEIIKDKLDTTIKSKKIYEWCNNNNVRYATFSNIINNVDPLNQKYPKIVKEILRILGYSVTIERTISNIFIID